MEITLKVEGKDKTFTTSFISARMLRKTIDIGKNVDFNNPDEKKLDILADYVVDLFGKQFTRDDFYDGVAASEMGNIVNRCITEVTQNGNKGEPNPNV